MTAIGLLLVNIAYAFYVYYNGPDPVVMKFDFQGNPIAWASKTQHFVFNTVFLVFTNGLIFGVLKLFGNDRSLTWVNVPHKEHWTKPENAEEALRRFRTGLDGVLIFINAVFLGAIHVTAGSVSAWTVNAFVLGVFAAAAGLIGWIYRLFAPRK